MRLFVAADPPPEALAHLGAAVDRARDVAGPDLRWQDPARWHLTLAFLGEVEDHRLDSIRQALATVAAPPFALVLEGLGCFPPRGPVRIVWAGVRPQPLLPRLHGLIQASLVPCGITGEERSYSPHITIARIKTPAAGVRAFVADHSAFTTEEIPVKEFVLYSSRLTPQGAIHTVEKRYPLTV